MCYLDNTFETYKMEYDKNKILPDISFMQIPLLFFIWAFTEIILQLTVRQILEKMHDSPKNKRYYFRSGRSVGDEKYDQAEKDEMDKLQNEEPILFIATNNDQKEHFYYRFENRTWVSDEELDVDSVKKEIKSYLKMKNI